jgi:hypothetical protein
MQDNTISAPCKVRRRHLVNCRYQLPHVGGVAALSIINGTMVAAVAAWLLLFRADPRMTANIGDSFVVGIAAVLLGTAVFSMVWSLRYTRHTAGLMHKTTSILRDMGDGKTVVTPVRFRKADAEFHAMEKELNRVCDRLDENTIDRSRAVTALHALKQGLESGEQSSGGAVDELQSIINTLNGGRIS